MFRQPEDDFDIGPMPAVAEMVCEKAPRMIIVLVWEEDAHTIVLHRAGVVVVAPDEAEEERSG